VLAFCVSQRHADFMKQYSRAAGLRVAAVHSGESSDPRTRSLERLQRSEFDVLFAVDRFNEGVDFPDVDMVLMLRPTELQILWLQQFGRGLDYRLEKRPKAIDYIRNHRRFLFTPACHSERSGGARSRGIFDGDSSTAYLVALRSE